ncbi:MAG TPA: hypothetical protein VGE40_13700 [Bacilli bacterium]
MSDSKLDLIIDELQKLNGKVDHIQSRVDLMENRFDQMQPYLVQNEQMTTQLIKMVSSNITKLDDIAVDVKNLSEDYERHDKILESLSMRSMEQETEIRGIRRIRG